MRPCPQCGEMGEAEEEETFLTCPHCSHEWDADDPESWPSADLDPSQQQSQRRIDQATVHSTVSLIRRLNALADRWDLDGNTQQADELRTAMGRVL